MSHNESNLGEHHTIVFDSIITNIDGANNNYSRIFTVPVSWVYFLSWTIANFCNVVVFTFLVVDNAEVNAIGTDSLAICDNTMTTGNAVLDLRVGQVVFIRTLMLIWKEELQVTVLHDRHSLDSFYMKKNK